jgi:MazG family protein
LGRLESLIASLLDPERGCPWDREQTVDSLTEDFLEECFELREAIALGQAEGVLEEGGDVAFLLAFMARLAEKKWSFGFKEMLDGAVDKMVRRHPHVFDEAARRLSDSEGVLKQWHQIKREKKASLLGSVPVAMPALARCHRLSSKAARAGFDWPDPAEVRKAVDLELAELDVEIALGDFKDPKRRERLRHELGDALMALANLARHLGFSAEKALCEANGRFVDRFNLVEGELAEKNLKPEDVGLAELERLWAKAKKKLEKPT